MRARVAVLALLFAACGQSSTQSDLGSAADFSGGVDLTASSSGPGAKVPFTTLEAEDPANRVTGTVVKQMGSPAADVSTPELEASGRGYVELKAAGDFVEFRNLPAANTIVIRHCIPDAATGGGISATLSLYVNGAKRQSVTLSSRHNWLYGPSGSNGQSNDPTAGVPHVFWEETRFFIVNGIQSGDSLRLQKDSTDTATYYRIDLIDLETAPAPLSPPAAGTYLDVTSYGADPSGAADSTLAMTKCLADAKAKAKIVWIPAGRFVVSAQLAIDSVTVKGAGMWATTLYRNVPLPRPSGARYSMVIQGSGAGLYDLFLDSSEVGRDQVDGAEYGVQGAGDRWTLENVWITHTGAGAWLGGTNGVVRGCRIRFTYADGININNGVSGALVENNHVRGTGDDGIALLSQAGFAVSQNDTVRSNTVSAVWWASSFDLAGGGGHIIEDNLLVDNALDGCLVINLPSAYPMNPVTGATIRNNSMVRCGGNGSGQARGAVWIYPGSATIDHVLFQGNEIRDPIFRGIHLTGANAQNITFDHNVVDMNGRGLDGILIEAEVTGAGAFTNNVVKNLSSGSLAFHDLAGAAYSVTQSGNSF